MYVQLCAPDDGAEEPPEICRASVEINKSRNVSYFWLQFEIMAILK